MESLNPTSREILDGLGFAGEDERVPHPDLVRARRGEKVMNPRIVEHLERRSRAFAKMSQGRMTFGMKAKDE